MLDTIGYPSLQEFVTRVRILIVCQLTDVVNAMFDAFAFAIIRSFIDRGTLHVTLGNAPPVTLTGRQAGPDAHISVRDRRTLWRLVTAPDLAFGEAYMDGHLVVPENGLEPLVDLLMTNSRSWAAHWTGRTTLVVGNALAWLRHLNPRGRARRNVAHHYDLSDRLFDTFLDPWRQYSCGYFHSENDSLEAAQVTKLARLAAKLDLQPDDRILDIGCGWGGLATAMAHCTKKAHVTGITLSHHQLDHARRSATWAGLEARLNFQLRDYRDQKGHFDKIISVGMLEHVGPQSYKSYFNKIKTLLSDNGVAVIHTIAVHHRAGPVNRWMTKYIFPGGYLPSVQQMVRHTEGRGLKLLDVEVMRGHYAETLRLWRLRFLASRTTMTALYDARFVRMWKFYLAGCEYFFRRQHAMVLQLQLAKDQMAAPMSRHYIRDREEEFKDKLWKLHPSGSQNPSPR